VTAGFNAKKTADNILSAVSVFNFQPRWKNFSEASTTSIKVGASDRTHWSPTD
jgi:hypothetical protein